MGIYLEHALILPVDHPARSNGTAHELITGLNDIVSRVKSDWNPVTAYASLEEALRQTCRMAMSPSPEDRQYRFVYITTGEGSPRSIREALGGWPASARAVIILVGDGVDRATWFIEAIRHCVPNGSIIAVLSEMARLDRRTLERVSLHLKARHEE